MHDSLTSRGYESMHQQPLMQPPPNQDGRRVLSFRWQRRDTDSLCRTAQNITGDILSLSFRQKKNSFFFVTFKQCNNSAHSVPYCSTLLLLSPSYYLCQSEHCTLLYYILNILSAMKVHSQWEVMKLRCTVCTLTIVQRNRVWNDGHPQWTPHWW